MESKVISVRLPENLIELIDRHAKEQRSDRATALRQWLYGAAEDYALNLVEEGRLSSSRASELLDVTIYDIYDMAEARGLRLGATLEQYEESMRTLEGLRKPEAIG